MLRLEARPEHSRVMVYMTPLIAIVLTVAVGAVLFAAMGRDPGASLYHFFISPLETRYGLSELLVKATPLALIGVGLSLGFRANVWNIGAEGQLTIGAIAGGAVGLAFWNQSGVYILPLMVLSSVLGGMAYAAIPALLKTRFNVNEILSSLMLTYVATLFLRALLNGPLKDPAGYGFPQSRLFTDSMLMPIIMDATRLHLGALIALGVVVVASIVLARTLFGFQVKVIGAAPMAAGFAGFSARGMVWASMLIGGGLAGAAGIIEVAGPVQQLVPNISPGYGFTAIIVAFLGRLHPVGVALAALLMALSFIGGENAQIMVGLPMAMTGVFQGMLLFFLLASDVLIKYRIVYRGRRARGGRAAPAADGA